MTSISRKRLSCLSFSTVQSEKATKMAAETTCRPYKVWSHAEFAARTTKKREKTKSFFSHYFNSFDLESKVAVRVGESDVT